MEGNQNNVGIHIYGSTRIPTGRPKNGLHLKRNTQQSKHERDNNDGGANSNPRADRHCGTLSMENIIFLLNFSGWNH